MIARIWHGAVRAEDADRYLDFLDETFVREFRAALGNRGVLVLREVGDSRADFLFTSFWDSMDAVRAFVGEHPERAIYDPRDEAFLLEMEPRVRHYEVFGEIAPDAPIPLAERPV